MNDKLESVITSVQSLIEKIEATEIPNEIISDIDPSEYAPIYKSDLLIWPREIIKKIKIIENYGLSEIDNEIVLEIPPIIEKSKQCIDFFINYSQRNQSSRNLINFIVCMKTIIGKIDSITSYEKMASKEVAPSIFIRKLELYKQKIEGISLDIDSIDSKVETINDAYNASITLPETTRSLEETVQKVKEIKSSIDTHSNDIESIKLDTEKKSKSISQINEESSELLKKIKSDHQEHSEELISNYKKRVNDIISDAETMMKQCQNALRITTSYGLSGAFNEKAKKLNWSIRFWVLALAASLLAAAYVGHERLNSLEQTLTSSHPSNFLVVIQIILSFFSLFAPLWFSWMATKQIGQRFKLAEDYEYKASISKAYEGYRTESMDMDESFRERLFGNALTRLEEVPLRYVSNDDYSSPIMEIVNSESMKNILKKAGETPEKFMKTLNSEKKSNSSSPSKTVAKEEEKTDLHDTHENPDKEET